MTDYEKRLDANLDAVLRASGSSLRYYTMPSVLLKLRQEMRAIMVSEYLAGSNACLKSLQEYGK